MRSGNESAFRFLDIPTDHRAILCLDGGGIRGIMTLQLLKKLEEVAGRPCYQLFDLVAGTSTGGIIAGLIATGHSAVEVEALYNRFVTQVFTKRSWYASKFADPPLWTKANYRRLLSEVIGEQTLRGACTASGIDLLITAHDVVEGEQTYFSYLMGKTNVYSEILLRAAMEATMSAPTYFHPLGRFVDGGTTTHNNPTLAAVTEAVQYGPLGAYAMDKLAIYSFGTGGHTQILTENEVRNPSGPDVAFWLHWLMTETGNDSSDMQSYLFRAGRIFPGLRFRRFQLTLDEQAIRKLPDLTLDHIDGTQAQRLHQLTGEELAGIEMDNVHQFPLMQVIGQAMADFVCAEAATRKVNPFTFDLIDAQGRELLVTRTGDIATIAKQMSNAAWIARQDP